MIRTRNNLNFARAVARQRAALGLYAHTAAQKMEADAKRNAPWADRTANARNSIQGDFGWRGDQLVIALSGRVDYFPYLELAMEKRYAILKPTIDQNAPDVLRGYQRLVRD